MPSRTIPLLPRTSMDKIDSERDVLCQDIRQPHFSQSDNKYLRSLTLAAFFSLFLLALRFWPENLFHGHSHDSWRNNISLDDLCPQVEAITSLEHEALLRRLDRKFDSTEFRLDAYESLGGAVRIPTESYDDLGPPLEDPRWRVMGEFHEYLESRFPKVHANLRRTKVNTYALVYEWKGSEDVKPLMLAAHIDTIPVNPETYDDWIHPPYSGYYDGEWIWGRGSSDDKASVIGSLIAVETLLEHAFVPSRTVILAFGMDEEVGGRMGASAIAQYLLETYGFDSIAMIVDEGETLDKLNGMVYASVGVVEKEPFNVRMDVLTPGGHSSTPPEHTGVGILANLITELEAHPPRPRLVRETATYQSLECRAKYDTRFPQSLITLLLESETSDPKLRELEKRLVDFDPSYYNSRTTQAINLVGGGMKVNALPEISWAVANNRIADHSSRAEVMAHFTDVILPVAVKHNMTLEAFGMVMSPEAPSRGTIHLYDNDDRTVASAPVSPTTGSGPYELLSGTIRSTIQTHLRTDDLPKSAVVAPGVLSGKPSTDTRHYFQLTKHIFRHDHQRDSDFQGLHTTNEAIRAEAFLEQTRFFARLILNADRTDLLE